MTSKSWWKFDLQVATPIEPNFKGIDTGSEEKRKAAAFAYVRAARDAGLDAIGLADHNSVEMCDEICEAADSVGLTVFPGFEITSATGSDGVHLIILAPPGTPQKDLDETLIQIGGFNQNHPKFNPSRMKEAASSPRTVTQILDDLPAQYLAIAPHIFSENGLASANTVKGDIRWKSLHHSRLSAVDVGNIQNGSLENKSTFKSAFIRRERKDFPCLGYLPFVATSDAYSLQDFGSRFTWIRMQEPSIEGLRQAFLDHEARILCDWQLERRDQNPNDISHAYVSGITIAGAATTRETLDLDFSPNLNVIIGGRGSGKSTLVTALRLLFGSTTGLPRPVQAEFDSMKEKVFNPAILNSRVRLPFSGQEIQVKWTSSTGSQAQGHDGSYSRTNFPVRVISQKELFERASGDGDRDSAGRNLITLTDDALAAKGANAHSEELEALAEKWITCRRALESERAATAVIPEIEGRIKELEQQLAAFDGDGISDARVERLQTSRSCASIFQAIRGQIEQITYVRAQLSSASIKEISSSPATLHIATEVSEALENSRGLLDQQFEKEIRELNILLHRMNEGPLGKIQQDMSSAEQEWISKLAEVGVDPNDYGTIKERLEVANNSLSALTSRKEALESSSSEEIEAWRTYEAELMARSMKRTDMLDDIANRAGTLRFSLKRHADSSSWVTRVRQILGLRSDGFIEDVEDLATWLWQADGKLEGRHATWRAACASADFSAIARVHTMRATFLRRLQQAEPLALLQIAAEMAEDLVEAEFSAGKVDGVDAWQSLATGSPGQRSSAMLGFVLNQGDEPLVLDQPEDDLDAEWITQLVVAQLRHARRGRQMIIITHNANIPVNGDADRVIVLENSSHGIRVKKSLAADGSEESSLHIGPLEVEVVRLDIQSIMEGGVEAFVQRERRYNNELDTYREAMGIAANRASRGPADSGSTAGASQRGHEPQQPPSGAKP